MLQRLAQIGDQLARKQDTDELLLDMAFSSEEPYQRWWGIEILDHNEKSIRLGRLNDGAPVLFNHDWDEIRGTHEPGSVHVSADRKLRGTVRLTSATQAGKETSALVQSKILTKASISYQLHRVIEKTKKKSGELVERELDGALFERVLARSKTEAPGDLRAFHRSLDAAAGHVERAENELSTYIATDWEPLENSLVTVPADNTVGVGRSLDSTVPFINPANPAAIKGGTKVSDESNAAAGASADDKTNVRISVGEPSANAVEIEKGRVAAIRNIAKANKIDDRTVDYWVANGIGMEGVSDDLLRILEERGKANPQSAAALGMSKKEASQFSLARAINACATNDWKLAPFELDCSRQVASKMNKPIDTQRFFVPFEVLQREMPVQRRDLTTQVPGDGGYLVATENMGFVEILRNRSVAFRMGARRLSGLNGNVSIPKQTGAGTAYWLATESSQTTESQQAFQQIALTPKTASAYTEISRNLLLQSSPGAEGIVSDDLGQVVALAVDLAALSGSGAAGQPTGISNTTGIGSVTATSVDYAKVLEFQTDVATSNVTPSRGGYVTTPAAAAVLMAKQRFSSTDTPLWQGNVWDGTMVGFPAMSSNQLSAGMIFGDWSELVIGEWGVLEIAVNPYANFQAGIIGVRAMYSMDVGLRRAFAFSYASSVTA
jgi:HK97 family phage major capsid protein